MFTKIEWKLLWHGQWSIRESIVSYAIGGCSIWFCGFVYSWLDIPCYCLLIYQKKYQKRWLLLTTSNKMFPHCYRNRINKLAFLCFCMNSNCIFLVLLTFAAISEWQLFWSQHRPDANNLVIHSNDSKFIHMSHLQPWSMHTIVIVHVLFNLMFCLLFVSASLGIVNKTRSDFNSSKLPIVVEKTVLLHRIILRTKFHQNDDNVSDHKLFDFITSRVSVDEICSYSTS